MSITPALEKWLFESGYEYHCFISWAHTQNVELTECAKRIKKQIENELALSIPNPKVFLDEHEITGGSKWETMLEQALCKSIAMVAICAPIYYHPSHKWCGLEWTAMENLGETRLPNQPFKVIIPLLLKHTDTMPEPIKATQYIDISKLIIRGRDYFRSQEFRGKVQEIVGQIEKIAQALEQYEAEADCKDFGFPQKSAFSDYQSTTQPFPFRK